MNRLLLLSAGWAMVALGVVGIFTPLLPTTPFLLVAAFCFERSSPRFHRMLLRNRYLNSYIENYKTGRGVPVEVKLKSLGFLWVALFLSSFLWAELWYWALLFAVGAGVTLHILLLKTDRRRQAGFTLIELLVSVAIIAILAGLTLPALGRARERGRAAACQGNARQLGQANSLYMRDFYDFPVPYGVNEAMDADGYLWLGYQRVRGTGPSGPVIETDLTDNLLLGSYLGEGSVTLCPGVRYRVDDLQAAPFGGGYGYNALWLGRYPQGGEVFAIRVSRIARPSRVVMFADNGRTTMGPFKFDPPQLSPLIYCREKPLGGTYSEGTVSARHLDRSNVTWVDGHVSPEPIRQLNADGVSYQHRVGFLGEADADPCRID